MGEREKERERDRGKEMCSQLRKTFYFILKRILKRSETIKAQKKLNLKQTLSYEMTLKKYLLIMKQWF